MMTRHRDLTHTPRLQLLMTRALWFLIAFACVYVAVRS